MKEVCCLLIPGVTQGALSIPHTLLCPHPAYYRVAEQRLGAKRLFPTAAAPGIFTCQTGFAMPGEVV